MLRQSLEPCPSPRRGANPPLQVWPQQGKVRARPRLPCRMASSVEEGQRRGALAVQDRFRTCPNLTGAAAWAESRRHQSQPVPAALPRARGLAARRAGERRARGSRSGQGKPGGGGRRIPGCGVRAGDTRLLLLGISRRTPACATHLRFGVPGAGAERAVLWAGGDSAALAAGGSHPDRSHPGSDLSRSRRAPRSQLRCRRRAGKAATAAPYRVSPGAAGRTRWGEAWRPRPGAGGRSAGEGGPSSSRPRPAGRAVSARPSAGRRRAGGSGGSCPVPAATGSPR